MTVTRRMIGGGVLLYCGTVAATYAYTLNSKDVQANAGLGTSVEGRRKLWEENARSYDREVRFEETMMGMPLLRRWLLRKAAGKVLEVSAGSGVNARYYRAGCDEVVMTDRSQAMLDIAQEATARLKRDAPTYKFEQQDAEHLRYGDSEFDTVVDTLGLCSCEDPRAVLKEMQRVCKPGGRLLLLEHGRSRYSWLNKILDLGEAAHMQKWGCAWNRPIDELLEEEGVQVDSVRRYHFGTTYMVVARPGRRKEEK